MSKRVVATGTAATITVDAEYFRDVWRSLPHAARSQFPAAIQLSGELLSLGFTVKKPVTFSRQLLEQEEI